MTLIEWLVTIEIAVSAGFIVWLLKKALWHARQSPAATALQKHLAELEAEASRKTQKEETK